MLRAFGRCGAAAILTTLYVQHAGPELALAMCDRAVASGNILPNVVMNIEICMFVCVLLLGMALLKLTKCRLEIIYINFFITKGGPGG